MMPHETDVSKTDSTECMCADYVQLMYWRQAAKKWANKNAKPDDKNNKDKK